MQELSHLFKVALYHATRRQGGSSNPNTSRCNGGSVTGDAILVERNGNRVTELFILAASQSLRLEIPQDQMIARSTRGNGVAHEGEFVGQGDGILFDLMSIHFELGCVYFLELRGNGSNLVFVGSTLQGVKDGLIDFGFKVTVVLAEKDHACARTTERFVCSGGDDIAVRKGIIDLLGGDQSRRVCHVHHEETAIGVGDFAESLVVIVTRVRRATSNDHGWFEESRISFQLVCRRGCAQ